jgi:aspartyl-tRNA(Asn)/glutamyl-tRNA(Gln) amidotransferase subunit C
MNDRSVDHEEVRHVAHLARVELDDADVEAFADQFGDILERFEALDAVPEANSETELVNVMRADEVSACLSQDGALANAPESEDGYFKGPNVS